MRERRISFSSGLGRAAREFSESLQLPAVSGPAGQSGEI